MAPHGVSSQCSLFQTKGLCQIKIFEHQKQRQNFFFLTLSNFIFKFRIIDRLLRFQPCFSLRGLRERISEFLNLMISQTARREGNFAMWLLQGQCSAELTEFSFRDLLIIVFTDESKNQLQSDCALKINGNSCCPRFQLSSDFFFPIFTLVKYKFFSVELLTVPFCA